MYLAKNLNLPLSSAVLIDFQNPESIVEKKKKDEAIWDLHENSIKLLTDNPVIDAIEHWFSRKDA